MPQVAINTSYDVEMWPTAHRMWAANGTKVQLDGKATIPVEIDGRRLDTEALISLDTEEPMIGGVDEGSSLSVGLSWIRAIHRRPSWGDAYTEEQAAMLPTECWSGSRHHGAVPVRATLLSTKWPTAVVVLTMSRVKCTVRKDQPMGTGETYVPAQRAVFSDVSDAKYEPFAVKSTDWKATGKDGKLAKQESEFCTSICCRCLSSLMRPSMTSTRSCIELGISQMIWFSETNRHAHEKLYPTEAVSPTASLGHIWEHRIS